VTERFYSPVIKYTTSNLTTLPGALLYFYETGTSTPKTTWTDPERDTASAHPVVALSDGTFPPIFINGVYRVELKNAAGVTQPGWPVDDVGSPAAGFPFQSWSSTYSYSEDDLVVYNGEFYQSLDDANVGNTPSTSPLFWQKKLFLDAPTAESYLNGNADGTYTWRTIAQTKSDLSLPTDTVAELALKATIASPAFTGNPTAPTPSANDNDTSIATTAYVQTELLDRVQFVDSIAALKALTGIADESSFLVNSGDESGLYTYDAAGSGSATFWNVIPDTLPGRFIKIKSDSDRVVFNAVERQLSDVLEELDDYADTINTQAQTNLASINTINARFVSTRFLPPSGFGWNPPMSIWCDSLGNVKTNFDVSINRYRNNGAYVWIDPAKADNTGDGLTAATAKRDLSAVLSSSTTYDTVFIVPGAMFDRDATRGWGGALSASKNVICPGGRAKITRRFAATSWTNVGSGVFSCTRSSVKFCWDTTIIDEFGHYTLIEQFPLLADLATEDSGWYTDGTTLYVKRDDLAEPTIITTAIFLQEGSENGSAIIRGDVHFYCENIDFEGGYAPLFAEPSSSAQNLQIYGKNCTFRYSYIQDGLTVVNARKTYLQGCEASRNVKDGFNYHMDAYPSEQCYFIEVDCSGFRNGIDQEALPLENNRNGSTAHDGIIGVRVNSDYYDCHGPVVIDVLDAITWNINVSAHNSQGESTDGSCTFSALSGATMWLDRCSGHSSPEGVVVGSTAAIYYRDSYLDGTNNIIGTFDDY